MPPIIGAGAAKGLIGKAGAVTKNAGFSKHAIGVGMSVGMSMIGSSNIIEGAAMGGATYAIESFVPGAFWINTIGKTAGKVTQTYIEEKRHGNGRIQKNYKGNFGGEFRDSQGSYTMRQRGVAAIQQSKLNARSVLGSEARSFHTSY